MVSRVETPGLNNNHKQVGVCRVGAEEQKLTHGNNTKEQNTKITTTTKKT